jgi:antitoxin (DNA-binding transcriptional repressor) of toxin-antitoxin stability system
LPVVRSVGLKALKNRLSEYVRLAAAGETVLISDRDRVVAELVPPRATRSASLPDAVLAEAVRRGLLTPAALPPGAPPETEPVASLQEILAELANDRAER